MSADEAVRIARISTEPLDLAAHVAAVSDAGTGAVATFLGTVRDHDPGARGDVVALEYSAHPDAEAILTRIATECVAAADQPCAVAVSHRIGHLSVGESAVIVAAGSAHRATAFAVCRDVIERVKIELPIWKRQHESDGTAMWVGLNA